MPRIRLLLASGESRVAFHLFKELMNLILMCHSCSGSHAHNYRLGKQKSGYAMLSHV